MENVVATRVMQKQSWVFSPVFKALIAGLVALAAIFTVTWSGSVPAIVAPLIFVTAGVLLVAALRNWEFGVQALMVVVIFEGAVRKWFLPNASDLVYFYKDVLLLVSLIGYLSDRKKPRLLIKRHLQLLLIAIGALVLYALASAANPSTPHPLVSLLGLKAYCLYIPLAFMVPRIFSTKQKLINFLRWYLVLALPVIILSVAQFRDADAGSQLNRYAWTEQTLEAREEYGTNEQREVSAFQDSRGISYVRVTGTFSYISGLAVYLPVVFALLLGLTEATSSTRLSRFQTASFLLAIAALVAITFMTGSRSLIVSFAVIAALFLAFSSMKSLRGRLKRIALGGVFAYLVLAIAFPEALDAMKTRAIGSDEQIAEGTGRIENVFRLPREEGAVAGAFGFGIGSTQNSVPSLMSKLDLEFAGDPIPIGYEDESSRVMLDLGVVGYLIHLFLRFILLITLWRICLEIKDRSSKALAMASVSVLTIYIIVGGAVVNHTQSVYQWFLIGIPLAMLNAEKIRNRRLSPPRPVL